MGIPTFLAAVLKRVSWQKVAGLAMEYGPELYRKAHERLLKGDLPPEQLPAVVALRERVDQLERLLVEQEEVIRAQVARNEQLEDACLKLEGRMNRFRIVSVVLAGISILLAIMLLRNG